MAESPGVAVFGNSIPKREEDESDDSPYSPGVAVFKNTGPEPVAPAATPTVEEPATTEEEPDVWDKIRHVAGAPAQAFFDAIDLPANLSEFAEQTKEAFSASAAFSAVTGPLKAIGLLDKPSELPVIKDIKEFTTKRTVTREQAPNVDALRTMGEWAAGGIPRAIRQGLKAAIPDVLMGLGAGSGQRIAGDKGELIGGGIGLIAALRTGNLTGLSAADKEAFDFIKRNAENPELAMKNLAAALQRKEKGTLSDLTGDQGIFDIEAATAKLDEAGTGRRVAKAIKERDQQVADDVAEAFGDEVDDVVTQARDVATERGGRAVELREGRITEAQARSEAQVSEALTASQKLEDEASAAAGKAANDLKTAEEVIPSTGRLAQTSVELSEAFDTLERTLKEEFVNPAWEKFKAGLPFEAGPVVTSIEEAIKKAPTRVQNQLNKGKMGDLMSDLDRWKEGDVIEPDDLSAWLSDAKAINREADKAGNFGSANKYLSDAISGIDEALKKSNKDYAAAVAATKDMVERTKDGRVAIARLKDEPETTAKLLKFSGEEGAATARLIARANDDGVNTAVQNRLFAEAKRDGISMEFMDEHAEILDLPQFSAVRDRLQGVVIANEAKLAADANAAATKKAQENYRKSLNARIDAEAAEAASKINDLNAAGKKSVLGMYAANPHKTLKAFLTPDKVGNLKSLFESVVKGGGEQAFKAHVRNELMSRMIKRGDDRAVQAVKTSAIDEFFKVKDILVESGVISKADADVIHMTLARSTGSATKRKQAITSVLEKSDSELNSLIASGAAAFSMKFMPGGQSLIMAGAARRLFKTLLAREVAPGTLKAMEEFLGNPAKFFKTIPEAKSADEVMRKLETMLVAAGQTAEIAAGE